MVESEQTGSSFCKVNKASSAQYSYNTIRYDRRFALEN